MRKALDLRVFCLLFAAFACQSAFAKFFPVNGGMVNQATVLTANILTPSTFVATGNQVIVVEGTDNQILKLPNATKLPLDWWYRVLNNSTGYVTVRDGSGADIASVNTTRAGEFYLKGRSSAAGTWKKQVSASAAELDANYYLKSDFVSTGPSADKPIKTGSDGLISSSLLPASGAGWSILGNAGLTAGTHFLGTADAVDLVFKTAGVEWFRITSAGVLTTQLAGGLVKSTAGALGLAVAGTDYLPATSGSAIQKADGAGGLTAAVTDTDFQAPITLGAFGSSPNNNGLTFSSDVLNMQPADATHGGGVSTTTQTFAGAKTFSSAPTFSTMTLGSILFSGTGGLLSQDNANYFWDATNHRLGIGTASPGYDIDLEAQTGASAQIFISRRVDHHGWLLSVTTSPYFTLQADNGYHTAMQVQPVGVWNFDRGNESSAASTYSFGHSYDETSSNVLMTLWGTSASYSGDLFRAYDSTATPTLKVKIDGAGKTWLTALDMQSTKITNVTDPSSAQDAATKNYVDTHTSATSPVVRTVTANTVATTGDDFILCNSATGDLVVTLYTAASASRKQLQVKDISQSGTCTVNPASTAEGIFISTGNEAQVILSPRGNALGFEPDGSSTWYVF